MSKAVSTVETSPISVLVNTIQHKDMQEVIRKTLPTGVSQERFTQATIAALKHKPEVFLECDRASVYNAIVEAAKDGLLPDGRHGALAPFNTKVGDKYVKKCQFLIMPEGIIDKLAKIGITAYAVSVYSGDKVRIWNDDHGQHVEHEPATFGNRGERIGAYACARIRDTGATYVEAMNMEDLEAPKRVTKSKDKNGNLYGPWADFTDRMEQKTCLHRICKRLPNVAMSDDEEFREERGPVTLEAVTTPPAAAPSARPAALQRVVEASRETEREPGEDDEGMPSIPGEDE
jgi:phage RecT family recombinase